MKVKSLSPVQLLATSWTAAYQAPPSMGFSRPEYWSGVPLPSPNYMPPSLFSLYLIYSLYTTQHSLLLFAEGVGGTWW